MGEKFCPGCEERVVDKFPPCPLQCRNPKCKAYKRLPLINTNHKPLIWVLGGPGSGRGGQCEMIQKKYNYKHICTGDLLREEVTKETNRSLCIRNILKRHGLVPTDIVIDLIREKIKELEPTSIGFLIDGFPRNENQAKAFEKTVCVPNLIIFLQASTATLISREMKRIAQKGGAEENEESLKQRVATYFESNTKILQLYADSGKLVAVDAEKTPEQVSSEIVKCLDPIAKATKAALDTAIEEAKKPIPLPPVPETAKAAMAKMTKKVEVKEPPKEK